MKIVNIQNILIMTKPTIVKFKAVDRLRRSIHAIYYKKERERRFENSTFSRVRGGTNKPITMVWIKHPDKSRLNSIANR